MLLDAPSVLTAHTSLGDTGVTALVAANPAGMVAAVDVRGGGPGTRETDLLEPYNTVERVHAIMLCGGSAFGLAAADGAAAVATALDAERSDLTSGSVGAGCGATAGVLRGGVGHASAAAAGYTVAACVVANPVGSVVDPATGLLYGDPSQPAVDLERFRRLERPAPKLNTTIGVIATDAPLIKAQLKRIAMTGHDGIARAVRPAHSPLDGDTLFAVSTAVEEAPVRGVEALAVLGEAAAGAVQAAIVSAVVHADSAFGVTAWRDLVGR